MLLLSVVDGLAVGLLYFTLAVGLSLVFGMMDVLNLAHGVLYLAGAYVAYRFMDGGWAGLAAAIAIGAAVGVAGGALLAAMARPLSRRGHLDQALLTLGLSLVVAELFMIVSGGENLPTSPPAALRGSVALFGQAYPVYRLLFIGVAGALAVAVYLVFTHTAAGALIRATVADRDMVRVLGYRPVVITAAVFVAGAVLAVVGGVLGAPILGPGPGVDEHVLVMSLVVVVLGGLNSVRGAVLAALLVGQVETLGRAMLPQFAAFLLFGAMFLVLAVRPAGLRGTVRTA